MRSLGVTELSHLHLRFRVLGGADDGAFLLFIFPRTGANMWKGQPEALSSRPRRTQNTKQMDLILEAEQLDEFGNPAQRQKSVKRKRTSQPQPRPANNSDPEDNDYGDGNTDDASSSGSDSDIEEVISNVEASFNQFQFFLS